MQYTKIIFERLALIHLPSLSYYLWKQKEIKFFDNDGSAKKKNWVKKLIKEGKILAIPPIGYVYNECYGTALDNVERVYKCLTTGSTLVREMVKIYGDENIELAYKKQLTRELSEFYYINSYLHREESQLQDNERILFTPYGYKKYLRLAKKSGAFYHDHRKIDVDRALNIFSSVYGFGNKVKAWLFQSGVIAFYLIKLMISRQGSDQVKDYQYAIPIKNPDYQFKFNNRSVDFLLDGNVINKDNTIFILLTPAITKDNVDEIRSKNLNMMDCSKRFMSSHDLDKREVIHILKRTLPYAVNYIFLGLFRNNILLGANKILLPVFFQWSFILSKINTKHFITFNDEGIDHIGRNVLLNRIGAKTWYYAHSTSFPHVNIPPNSNITDWRHWLWSFLYYDYYVSWNNEMGEYYELHPQKIGNYVGIGCMWSQSIVEILEGRIVSNLEKEMFANLERDKYKTLSFFDSTYLPGSVSPLEGGVAFYRCILKLMQEFPDILIIIKEKKSEESVLKVYENFGGTSNVFYEQYKPALDELRRHPRCYVTGYKGDPSEIIAMSDLTITYAVSSSTVEALCARKKAIFFDPCNRWRGCYYDKIPNFMAHSYEELKYLIQKLLYETSEEEYRDFLNTYVKGEMDPYLDGKAITRFRELLGK